MTAATDDLRPLAHSVKDAARLLSVSESHLRDLIAQGRIRAIRTSPRKTLVPRAAIDEFLDTREAS